MIRPCLGMNGFVDRTVARLAATSLARSHKALLSLHHRELGSTSGRPLLQAEAKSRHAQRRAAASAGAKLTQALMEALLRDAGQLARKAPDELTPADVRFAVSLHDKLPFESSPEVSA